MLLISGLKLLITIIYIHEFECNTSVHSYYTYNPHCSFPVQFKITVAKA